MIDTRIHEAIAPGLLRTRRTSPGPSMAKHCCAAGNPGTTNKSRALASR
jgi:hypothetical protein